MTAAANDTRMRRAFWRTSEAPASAAIMVVALLILLNSLIHAYVYGVRNYRDDEIVVIHISRLFSPSELVQHLASDTHPPGWQLLVEAWTEAFGINEGVTRWLSKLGNLITFALLFQLGKHLGGIRVGIFAIALMGVYGFASNHIYELRPYSVLVMLTTALHLLFFRWLHAPTSLLMVVYTMVGSAALYTHYFSAFVFPAHAICLLVFSRYDSKHWLNSVLMWIFIGVSYIGWLLPLLHAIFTVMPEIWYYRPPTTRAAWIDFLTHTGFRPAIVYYFLVALGFLSIFRTQHVVASPMRRGSVGIRYRPAVMYPFVLLVSTLAIAYVASHFVSGWSARNTVILTPLVAAIMAMGLHALPAAAGITLIALLYLHAPMNMPVHTYNGPYREMVHTMESSYRTDSIMVTETERAFYRLLPLAYYIMDFTPDKMANERMFHTVNISDRALPPTYPEGFVNVLRPFEAAAMEEQLPPHSQLWHIQVNDGNQYRADIQRWLDKHYALIRSADWDEGFYDSFHLSEYERVPAHEGPLLDVGGSLRLYTWQFQDSWSVAPCQSVTVASWWQIHKPDSTAYTISLILADEDGDGQIAIADAVPADRFTSDWEPGKYYRDRTSVVIPCDISDGQFDLLLAAKESNTGEPLRLAFPGGEEIGTEYYLTTLNVGNG